MPAAERDKRIAEVAATLELGPTGTYSTGLAANTPLGVRAEGGFARKFGSGNAGRVQLSGIRFRGQYDKP